MSSFKKNRSIIEITKVGNDIISEADDIRNLASNKIVKEITVPFTAEMSALLETIFNSFEGDISRRKLCSKYLLKSLRLEKAKLD